MLYKKINCMLYKIDKTGTTKLGAKLILSCNKNNGENYKVKIIQLMGRSGTTLLDTQTKSPVRYMQFTQYNNKIILVLDDNSFAIYKTKNSKALLGEKKFNITRKDIKRLNHENNMLMVEYSDSTLDVFSIANPVQILLRTPVERWSYGNNMLIIRHKDEGFTCFNTQTARKINLNMITHYENRSIAQMGIVNNNILVVQYDDNRINLFNTQTEKRISNNIINANQNEHIKKWSMRYNLLIVKYSDDTYDLFDIQSSRKVNREKKVKAYGTRNNILIIQYDDNTFDLLNPQTTHKINKEKAITTWKTIDNTFILQYHDNEIDIINNRTACKINLNIIQADQNKIIKDYKIEQNNILNIIYSDNTYNSHNIIIRLECNTYNMMAPQYFLNTGSCSYFYNIQMQNQHRASVPLQQIQQNPPAMQQQEFQLTGKKRKRDTSAQTNNIIEIDDSSAKKDSGEPAEKKRKLD